MSDKILNRISVGFVNDGGGHYDEMPRSDPNGEYYYADQVDEVIAELRKENEVLRQWHKEAVAQCLGVTGELTELRRDLARYENAHKGLVAENDALRKRLENTK